jgi:hypothetical protein
MKKLFIVSLFLFSGCVSLPLRISGWSDISNREYLTNNNPINIVGNPELTCYNKNNQLIADGYFVKITNKNKLEIDEFGKDYVYLRNNIGNYCYFSKGN